MFGSDESKPAWLAALQLAPPAGIVVGYSLAAILITQLHVRLWHLLAVVVGLLSSERAIRTDRGGFGSYAFEVHLVQRKVWIGLTHSTRERKSLPKQRSQLLYPGPRRYFFVP